MRRALAGLCAAGCAVATPGQALAQAPMETSEGTSDDPIFVTGRILSDVDDLTSSSRVVLRDDDLIDASGRMEVVLKQVDGLTSFRRSDARSAHPTSGGVTMRGLGGNAASRALVTLDGVPQGDPFGGWVNWTALDIVPARQVTVTRGGGSGIDGPGALAGTIAITTADGIAPSAQVAAGSRASALVQANAGLGSDRARLQIGGRIERGDGFVPIADGGRGMVDRAAPYRQWGLGLGATGDLGATTVRVTLRHTDDRRERGTAFTDSRIRATDWAVQWGRDAVDGRQGWALSAYGQMRTFRSSFAAVGAGRASVTQSLDQFSVPATGLGLRAEWRPALGPDVTLRLGGDTHRQEGATHEDATFVAGRPTRRRVAGGVNATMGLFADLIARPAPRWTVSVGGRVDRWRIGAGFRNEVLLTTGVPTAERHADRVGVLPTGRLGMAWDVGGEGGLTLRASAYRGWRLPTLNELYRPFRAGADATAANAALRPERFDGAEIGAQWAGAAWRLDVTGFAGTLDNAIANVQRGAGPGQFPGVGFVGAGGIYRQRANLDAIRTRGVEWSGEWRGQGLTIRGGVSYVDARVRGGPLAPALNGKRPAQVPRWSAHGTIAAELPFSTDIQLTARYTGHQFDDDANRNRLADAITFDSVFAAPVTSRVQVQFRTENLLNRRIEAALLPNGAVERAVPRTLWLGVTLRTR